MENLLMYFFSLIKLYFQNHFLILFVNLYLHLQLFTLDTNRHSVNISDQSCFRI